MPSRWWVPLRGSRPESVKAEHVHAAFSRWFDQRAGEHGATTKAYALSPLADSADGVLIGLEIGTLTDEAEGRLQERVWPAGVRLGPFQCLADRPVLLRAESWDDLAVPSGARQWTLLFRTPTTFRRGSQSSPFPTPAAVLRGLQQSWSWCNPSDPRELTRGKSDQVWVSAIDAASQRLAISGLTWSGLVGSVTFRCDDSETAGLVDGLFRLAPYSGVGSAKAKGLGVTDVVVGTPRAAATRNG